MIDDRPLPRPPLSRRFGHLLGAYGLLVLTALLFLVFSLALPDTFPTLDNVSSILSNQSIPAVLALGAMIPIVTGKFDLSIGYGLGLAHVMAMQLIVNEGWPWPLACLAVVLGGAVVGVAQRRPRRVRAGSTPSSPPSAPAASCTPSPAGSPTAARIVPGPQGLPAAFTDLYDSTVPRPAGPRLLRPRPRPPCCGCCWSGCRSAGTCTSSAPTPAPPSCVGIPTRRYVIYAFAGSGLIVGFAGVLLAAQQQIGNPSVGLDYLLPAFVGALLGSTAIKPGRANALGTLVAVAILAIGLAGIGQLGAQFWVTPLFNGATLLIAVGMAGYAARRQLRQRRTRTVPAPCHEPATTGRT